VSVFAWIMLGVLAWGAVAGYVGVLVGRVIRRRDGQLPEE
jgi:hypothetical protein